MCGRYTLTAPVDLLEEEFGIEAVVSLGPRYNIAPTQPVPVVIGASPRRLEEARWGLIPNWANDPAIGNRLINARAETLAEKPAFRDGLRQRRCLVLADGFFEWKRSGRQKIPYLIRLRSGRPFAFAGLWEQWRPPNGTPVRSCTIVTTEPNREVRELHDRMPAILRSEHYSRWLANSPPDPHEIDRVLRPLADGSLEMFPVSPLVNSPQNDGPECIERYAPRQLSFDGM